MGSPALALDPEIARATLVKGDNDFASVTNKVAQIVETPTPKAWFVFFGLAALLAGVWVVSVGYLVWEGIGIWGLNQPIGWAWDITGFVFWVGIGHAGTLISAILFLFRQKWRTSINRAAEAMTLFAVLCALSYVGIHTGRPWFAYWFIPVPNQMGIWQNYRSPLMWDFFALNTYFTVSLLFWYVGLIPDLATLRDRATTKTRQIIFGVLSMGWRGANRHWRHYEKAYLILAGLSTPLVLSVHTIVSFDFATSVIPGWHTTIFPPYFVAGAIFGGFAMVNILLVPAREWFGLKELITLRHVENMNKIILATGMMVGYAYCMEFFIAWYSDNDYEFFTFINRAFGPYKWAYWSMFLCNVASPQVFWFKRFRTSIPVTFVVALFVTIGMWFERFVIIGTSIHRDFLPSAWGYFRPTIWDISTFAGTFGVFLSLFLLFVRFLPMVAISEVKGVMPQAKTH
ncbi:MAG: polysulfide reductase NrfD [Deltaproteobacteria bacterium]|nr:polysulfide reductase NrfD [Deltaproteobacteria bacterium]